MSYELIRNLLTILKGVVEVVLVVVFGVVEVVWIRIFISSSSSGKAMS